MKLKKLFTASLLVITALLVTLFASSCNSEHEHSFAEWQTVTESNCTSYGLQKRSCECGYVEYENKDVLPHTPVTDPAVGATCTTPGFTEGSHCSVCNTVIVAQTVVDKLAHSFAEWQTVVAPTCTSFGLNSRVCACGEIEYLTVAATAHTPVTDPAVGATCTTPGFTEGSHCSACGVVFAAQGYIAPTGHNCDEVAVIEEALCNLDGTKRYSCSNTGCDYYYDEAYALAETSGDEIFAKAKEYTGLIQTHDFLGSIILEASAFVISPDGVIVTSNFAIDNAFSACFVLNGECYDVTDVLAYSAASSIAVLKVNATDLPYAPICVAEPTDAETVYTVGVLGTHQYSISRGIISNANVSHGGRYIVHDADMSEGYRGGPLLNRFGEVIGINAAYDLDGSTYLNYSAWVAEIENLDYSSPITIAEYGEATFTPSEYIAVWANSCANAYQNDISAYVVQGSNFYYAICNSNSGPFVEGYWVIDGTYKINVKIKLGNCTGTYEYAATFSDGRNTNETSGIIDAATFDASTLLTYESYYGSYWNEAELMALYTEKVYDTIGWLSYCLESYFVDLTLADLGFAAVSYDRNEDALAKINEFIMSAGAYDESIKMYSVSGSAQHSNGTLIFSLCYEPVSGTTIVDISYYLNTGYYYRLWINLTPEELGNYFSAHSGYIVEEEYYMQNYCWGYVDAANFTDLSTLTCFYYTGLEGYEDGVLQEYAMLVGYVVELLNSSVLPVVDPTLTVADLGFYFYFG